MLHTCCERERDGTGIEICCITTHKEILGWYDMTGYVVYLYKKFEYVVRRSKT
jgi:hypothetical protein